jgi:hypothetical protein
VNWVGPKHISPPNFENIETNTENSCHYKSYPLSICYVRGGRIPANRASIKATKKV